MGKLVFLTSLTGHALDRVSAVLGLHSVVRTAGELHSAAGGGILLSHATSVIVPQSLLDKFSACYNVHSASPMFPGRDPHHFAIYRGATRYGATCHLMTDRVDAGPIVDVELFDVAQNDTPSSLLARADDAAAKIIKRISPLLERGQCLSPNGMAWGSRKTTRADFHAMCRLTPEMDTQEIERRVRAFGSTEHQNFTFNGEPFQPSEIAAQ